MSTENKHPPGYASRQRSIKALAKAVEHLNLAVALMNSAGRNAYVGGLREHGAIVATTLKATSVLQRMTAGLSWRAPKLAKGLSEAAIQRRHETAYGGAVSVHEATAREKAAQVCEGIAAAHVGDSSVFEAGRRAGALACVKALREATPLAGRTLQAYEPVYADLLPPLGSDVLIHLSSCDRWVLHTVVGYYVWGDHKGDPHLQRVFVRVADADGCLNSRILADVRRLDGTYFVHRPTLAPSALAVPAEEAEPLPTQPQENTLPETAPAVSDSSVRLVEGSKCSKCGKDALTFDSNGWHDFLRCASCGHVPALRKDGTEITFIEMDDPLTGAAADSPRAS